MFSLVARSLLKLHLTPCPFPRHALPALPIKCIDVPYSDLVSLGQNGNHDLWQSSSWFVKHEIRGMWQRKQLLVHKFKTSTRPLLELYLFTALTYCQGWQFSCLTGTKWHWSFNKFSLSLSKKERDTHMSWQWKVLKGRLQGWRYSNCQWSNP